MPMIRNEIFVEIRSMVKSATPSLFVSPLIDLLSLRWKKSHFIHGITAYDSGILARKPHAECVRVAAAIELSWIGILILDDIIDNDTVRYRHPTLMASKGIPYASSASVMAQLSATDIIHHCYESRLNYSVKKTIESAWQICAFNLDLPLDSVIDTYKKLGELSVFCISWPFPDQFYGKIAYYETLAGQLINDCNDCFGPKSFTRDYPDIRNKQITLLLSILNSYNLGQRIVEQICQATRQSDYQSISQSIKRLAMNEARSKIMGQFDIWMDHAMKTVSEASYFNDYQRQALKQRVDSNNIRWRKKLNSMISDPSQLVDTKQ